MSELSPVVLFTRPGEIIPGSTGKLIPNTRMKVADLGGGQALGPGETGELCFQGPQVQLDFL